jgi:hypothetical protein
MDEERRRMLGDKRQFMRKRIEIRNFQASLEPARTALERAGEAFRVYRIEDTPNWLPSWVPEGYSYIPWNLIPGASLSADGLSDRELAELTCRLLTEYMGPDDELLVVADVGDWSLQLSRTAFERHALEILSACSSRCWLTAPPAQWLVALEGYSIAWKGS